MRLTIIIMFALVSFSIPIAQADTINIPADYPTIQAGINAAVNGDTVLVAPGTYEETIDFNGKGILLTSSDGAESTLITNFIAVVFIRSGEGAATILDGFTIQGSALQVYSGIYCIGSSPTIVNNIIENNNPDFYGGGIHCSGYGSPVIMNNIIRYNAVSYGYFQDCYGGGIYIGENCSAVVKNNIIYGNNAWGSHLYGLAWGGAIYFEGESLFLSNNIITENHATDWGGGVFCCKSAQITNNIIADNQGEGIICHDHSTVINNTIVRNAKVGLICKCNDPSASIIVQNTIAWYNNEAQIEIEGPGTISITYSNIQGGWPGEGNIDADPLFVDPVNNDFHLTYNSPCRDTGDNSAVTVLYDFEGDPRIAWGGTVDMGADEFYTHLYITGDQMPGGSIQGKMVGLPGTSPVRLFIGLGGVLPTPLPAAYGDLWLLPPRLSIPLIPIPANGILTIPATIPLTPPAPYDIPMQGLVGLNSDSLTNLCVLEVR